MNSFTTQTALILLVDDDRQLVAEIAEGLEAAGHRCRRAHDIVSAREALALEVPDLIIADIDLGEDNGLAFCGEVRRQPELADVPVIVLSGAQIPNVVRRAKAAGGTFYLRKPYDNDVLIEVVDKALWMPHLVSSHQR